MDAATLYTVVAVASGPKRMTTEKFQILDGICTLVRRIETIDHIIQSGFTNLNCK